MGLRGMKERSQVMAALTTGKSTWKYDRAKPNSDAMSARDSITASTSTPAAELPKAMTSGVMTPSPIMRPTTKAQAPR